MPLLLGDGASELGADHPVGGAEFIYESRRRKVRRFDPAPASDDEFAGAAGIVGKSVTCR